MKKKKNQAYCILTRISINKFSQDNKSAVPVQQTTVLIPLSFINSWSCTVCTMVLIHSVNTNRSDWLCSHVQYHQWSCFHCNATLKKMLEFSEGQLFLMRSTLANFLEFSVFRLGFVIEDSYLKTWEETATREPSKTGTFAESQGAQVFHYNAAERNCCCHFEWVYFAQTSVFFIEIAQVRIWNEKRRIDAFYLLIHSVCTNMIDCIKRCFWLWRKKATVGKESKTCIVLFGHICWFQNDQKQQLWRETRDAIYWLSIQFLIIGWSYWYIDWLSSGNFSWELNYQNEKWKRNIRFNP